MEEWRGSPLPPLKRQMLHPTFPKESQDGSCLLPPFPSLLLPPWNKSFSACWEQVTSTSILPPSIIQSSLALREGSCTRMWDEGAPDRVTPPLRGPGDSGVRLPPGGAGSEDAEPHPCIPTARAWATTRGRAG